MAHRIRRRALVCLVVVGLGTAPAWAAPSHREARQSGGLQRMVTVAWHLWQSVWGKEGSSLDPFGIIDPGTVLGNTITATPQGGNQDGSGSPGAR